MGINETKTFYFALLKKNNSKWRKNKIHCSCCHNKVFKGKNSKLTRWTVTQVCKVVAPDELILAQRARDVIKKIRNEIENILADRAAVRIEWGARQWGGQTSYRRKECPAPGALGSDSCAPSLLRPLVPQGKMVLRAQPTRSVSFIQTSYLDV